MGGTSFFTILLPQKYLFIMFRFAKKSILNVVLLKKEKETVSHYPKTYQYFASPLFESQFSHSFAYICFRVIIKDEQPRQKESNIWFISFIFYFI